MDDSEGTGEGECGKLIWVIGTGADGETCGWTMEPSVAREDAGNVAAGA
jgi:hypothetical protein